MFKNKTNKENKTDALFKKKKTDFLSEFFALPADTFANYPSVHIKGNREIIIDGCTGLLNYSEENVVIETRFCKINIAGRSLNLHNLSDKIISIRGFIQKFEFTM